MECIAQCVQATLEVASVPGVTFDGAVEDTIRRAVRTVLASAPTLLVDSRSRERVRLTLKLASSANTVFASPEAESLDVCRAWAEGAYGIPPPLIAAAAAIGNGPFAGLMRISPERFAPNESVHHDAVGDTERRDADEYGARKIAGRLHAEGNNDSINVSASATVNALSPRCRGGESASAPLALARSVVASIDTGPQEEGAKENFRTVGSRRRDRMLDWNELTQSDHSLGPLPVFARRGEDESASIQSTYLRSESRRPGNSSHPAAVKAGQAPVIRCGMARIVSSADSDVADSKRRARSGRKCTKKGKTGAHAPTEARGKSSSRQHDKVHPFKRERSEVPEGGWFAQRISEPPPSPSMSAERSNSSEESYSDEAPAGKRQDRRKAKTSHFKKSLTSIGGLKIKKPMVYDGKDDLDVFDQWVYEVDTIHVWESQQIFHEAYRDATA